MAELKRYNVKIGKYETVLQLSDEDAKAQGLTESDVVGAKKAAPAKKTASGPVGAKKAAPANKARKATENKDA